MDWTQILCSMYDYDGVNSLLFLPHWVFTRKGPPPLPDFKDFLVFLT